jgi:hypothetical protein
MRCDEYAEVTLTLRTGAARLSVHAPDGRVVFAADYDSEHSRDSGGG